MITTVNRFLPLLLVLSFYASANSDEGSKESVKKAFFSLMSDYGIPVGTETVLEALRVTLSDNNPMCATGPSYYVCWYLRNTLGLQKYNIQNGLSKHLQDRVSSYAQGGYNYLFAPQKAAKAASAAVLMHELRSATIRSQSIESIKARITLAQLKPVTDNLFFHASRIYNQGQEKSLKQVAGVVAYAAVIMAAYFPEYEGNEPEIYAPIESFMKQVSGEALWPLVEEEVQEQFTLDATEDPLLAKQVERILCTWIGHKGHESLCSLQKEEIGSSSDSSNNGSMYAQTLVFGLLPGLARDLFPASKEGSIVRQTVSTAFNSLSQNVGEAGTRVSAMDFFSNMRRNVQRLGVPAENRTVQEAQSYDVLRERQFKVTIAWSELGLRMRANIQRYLAIVVPTLTETSHLLSAGKKEEAIAVFATLVAYVRQYDPEYGTNDIFLRMATKGILGEDAFDGLDIKSQIAKIDEGFNKSEEVRIFYDRLIHGLNNPKNVTDKLSKKLDSLENSINVPWSSASMSLLMDLVNLFSKTKIVPWAVSGMSSNAQEFSKEVTGRLLEVGVRGVGDPAKDDIQQFLASAQQSLSSSKPTQTEMKLVSRSVEMNGRHGGDAQIARAIYERLEPILFHLFDGARSAYQEDDKNASARMLAYALVFLAQIYPETPSDDVLLQDLATTRFSQFVNAKDKDFQNYLIKHIGYYNQEEDLVLDCLCGQRLKAFSLDVPEHLNEACKQILPHDSYLNQAKEAGKSALYISGMLSAFSLPVLAKLYAPKRITIPMAPAAVNFVATCATAATIGIAVSSVFWGITKNMMLSIGSYAQRWSQYPRTTHRIDENENWGRAQTHFGSRQWELARYLNPSAQEGRKDLLLVAQNIAQALKNVQLAKMSGDKAFADSQSFSLQYLLDNYYAEGKHYYREVLADMRYAFFEEKILNDTQSPIETSAQEERDEL